MSERPYRWRDRLSKIDSDASIDTLTPGSVVYVKNGPMRVFERRDGETLSFYYFSLGKVMHTTEERQCVGVTGNMLAFQYDGSSVRRVLTEQDTEYTRIRDDLVSLDLMLAD